MKAQVGHRGGESRTIQTLTWAFLKEPRSSVRLVDRSRPASKGGAERGSAFPTEWTAPRKLDLVIGFLLPGSISVLSSSKASQVQRERLVELFEDGWGFTAAARGVGVGVKTARNLWDRWRLHGRLALMRKPSQAFYSFETKLEAVKRWSSPVEWCNRFVSFGLGYALSWSGVSSCWVGCGVSRDLVRMSRLR